MANKSDVTTVFEDTILNSDLSSVMANISESIIGFNDRSTYRFLD